MDGKSVNERKVTSMRSYDVDNFSNKKWLEKTLVLDSILSFHLSFICIRKCRFSWPERISELLLMPDERANNKWNQKFKVPIKLERDR